jgi:hypothetical protein
MLVLVRVLLALLLEPAQMTEAARALNLSDLGSPFSGVFASSAHP